MYAELRTGYVFSQDGALNTARATNFGDLVVAQGCAEFQEAVSRGQGFSLDSGSVTLAAANVTGAALGTFKFINGFYNPLESGVNAVIWNVRLATVSGTPGGPFFYNYLNKPEFSSTPTGTIRSLLLSSANGSKLRPMVGVVMATVPADATTVMLQQGVVGGPAAIAAGAGMYDVWDQVNGRIIVPPGYAWGLACTAAGTTHVVHSTIQWGEYQKV